MRVVRVASLVAVLVVVGSLASSSSRGALVPPQIAFQTDRDGNFEIYGMNAGGTNQRNLTNDPDDDMLPSWSPTGERIVFTTNRRGQWQLWTMDADGSNQRQLAKSAGPDTNPAWSARGDKIAFETRRDGNWEIYALDLKTGRAQNLSRSAATNDLDPSWDANGTRIVYSSSPLARSARGRRLLTMSDQGFAKRPVLVQTVVQAALRPDWSTRTGRIAYTGLHDGNYDVYIVGSRTPVTRSLAEQADPAWSPDETRIAFTSSQDGNYEIYSSTADGKRPRNLTRNEGNDLNAAWRPQPRNGRRLDARAPASVRAAACTNSISGNRAANYLNGTACQDTIKAKAGRDTLIGRAAADWLYGEGDKDDLNSRLSDSGVCDRRVDGGPDPGDKARIDPCDPDYGIDSFY